MWFLNRKNLNKNISRYGELRHKFKYNEINSYRYIDNLVKTYHYDNI